ncbi:MAG: hypothetical protein K6C12_14825 [Oscillospiraceae bacterium]|nr:hypothetical protein [Oscillospiraceae bacterium]
MKKSIIIPLALTMLFSLAACGSGSVSKEADSPVFSPSPTAAIQPAETTPSVAPESKTEEASGPVSAPVEAVPADNGDPGAVDVDLTQLSSTMVYSEVYAMMYEPEQYIGKTVKMRGLFATQEYNGERLYACIVQDATACCAQGLEFETAEELVYPDEYPEAGAEITVVGTFDSYQEEVDGNYYIYLVLRDARFV